MPKTIDERIEALTQTVELIAGMQQKNEELITATQQQIQDFVAATQQQIQGLTTEVRKFVFWSEAVILNYESRLRALAKEPQQEPPKESR